MSINSVTLLGRVSSFDEPQIRTSNGGKKNASFKLVTTSSWKDKDGQKQTKYENHKIVVFNEIIVDRIEKYVTKGARLYIEGSLATRKWTDNSGVEKYTTEIVIQGFNGKIEILDWPNSEIDNKEDDSEKEFVCDDVPF